VLCSYLVLFYFYSQILVCCYTKENLVIWTLKFCCYFWFYNSPQLCDAFSHFHLNLKLSFFSLNRFVHLDSPYFRCWKSFKSRFDSYYANLRNSTMVSHFNMEIRIYPINGFNLTYLPFYGYEPLLELGTLENYFSVAIVNSS